MDVLASVLSHRGEYEQWENIHQQVQEEVVELCQRRALRSLIANDFRLAVENSSLKTAVKVWRVSSVWKRMRNGILRIQTMEWWVARSTPCMECETGMQG